MIRAAGHRLVFRAPYHPVDGPIEYVFNTIQQELTRALYRVNNRTDLMNEFAAVIARINDFAAYFIGCGLT